MSNQIKKREREKLNGKKTEDVLLTGDAAALIACICNMLASVKVHLIVFSVNETFHSQCYPFLFSHDETHRMRKMTKLLGFLELIGNGQWFLGKVGVLKGLRIITRC